MFVFFLIQIIYAFYKSTQLLKKQFHHCYLIELIFFLSCKEKPTMIKGILSSFFVITLFVSSISAQSLVVGTSNPTKSGAADEFELELGFTVSNQSFEQIPVKVRRTVLSDISGSSNFFCWLACYTEGTSLTPNPLVIDGESSSNAFSAHLRPNMNSGTAQIQYTFFNADNTSDSTNVIVTFEVTPLGIKNVVTESSVKAFPNPADDKLTLNFNRTTNSSSATLELFNMLGVKVASIPVSSLEGTVVIPTADLKSGLYFYSLKEDGKNSRPGRVTIKH